MNRKAALLEDHSIRPIPILPLFGGGGFMASSEGSAPQQPEAASSRSMILGRCAWCLVGAQLGTAPTEVPVPVISTTEEPTSATSSRRHGGHDKIGIVIIV
jgi:hypothetical protein